jgi:hypothetical protein
MANAWMRVRVGMATPPTRTHTVAWQIQAISEVPIASGGDGSVRPMLRIGCVRIVGACRYSDRCILNTRVKCECCFNDEPLGVLEADDQFLDDARPDLLLVVDPSRMGTRLVGWSASRVRIPLGALALFAEIRHRGSGFGPVAVTSRWGTQSST